MNSRTFAITLGALIVPCAVRADEGNVRPAARLPEGSAGIAARYPGDEGIGGHADVVFVENFNDDLGSVKARGEPFEGFRWRTDAGQKLNFLWLLCYITKSPRGHLSKIWFDDIVVAKEYIGPVRPPR
jgi:hypothetical protein